MTLYCEGARDRKSTIQEKKVAKAHGDDTERKDRRAFELCSR